MPKTSKLESQNKKFHLGANLNFHHRDIEKFLKGYGRIRNISVKVWKDIGAMQALSLTPILSQEGFGFAEFEDRRDAEDVVKVIF